MARSIQDRNTYREKNVASQSNPARSHRCQYIATYSQQVLLRYGYNDTPLLDLPPHRDEGSGQNDHTSADDNADEEGQPEPPQNLRDLNPEVGPFDFFLRGAPCDVVREDVCEEGLGDVDAEATEEEKAAGVYSQWNPKIRQERITHKNGIQLRFSTSESRRFLWPRRYSRRVNPILPAPGKTTTHASQISKLFS